MNSFLIGREIIHFLLDGTKFGLDALYLYDNRDKLAHIPERVDFPQAPLGTYRHVEKCLPKVDQGGIIIGKIGCPKSEI